jgi:CDP-4-dehydro-6-deoxyglucose reductase, E3
MTPTMHHATVTSTRMLAPTVREITLDPGPGFAFVPGQWVSLRVPQPGGEELGRAYSIASPPRDDGRFDLAVTRVEGGPGSSYLHTVEPGAVFQVTQAQGFFTLAQPTRPVVMVGTGTGVAPLRSMLFSASREAQAPPMPFVLLFGVRTEQDILYRAEFEALEHTWAAFRFVPTLSRPAAGWAGRRGYVQVHLPEIIAALGGDCDVYACGLNRMLREVRRVLKEDLGLPRQRIHTERYD